MHLLFGSDLISGMAFERQFGALAHPMRQRLLDLLARSPASVRELTDAVGASQPAVSQHLRVLREAGLVCSTPSGARNIYRVDAAQLDRMQRFVRDRWMDP